MPMFKSLLVSAAVLVAPMAQAVELPEIMETAVSAGPQSDTRDHWRFRITVEMADGPVIGRFDGAAPDGQRWDLISPSINGMTEEQSEIWSDLIEPDEDEEDAGGLFLLRGDLEHIPGSVNLLEERSGVARFGFDPQLDEDEAPFAEFVTGEYVVNTQTSNIDEIRVYARESFKPNVAMRINTFELTQNYERLDGMPGPVLTRISQNISGSMAFQRFNEVVEIHFDEIEYLAR